MGENPDMMAMVRLGIFGLIGLSVAYVAVSVYARSLRREELEKEWAEEGAEGERADFVAAGMRAYEGGLRRKLIWLVFIVPVALFCVTVYLVNYD